MNINRNSIRLYPIAVLILLLLPYIPGEAGDYAVERNAMVDKQIAARGVKDKRLLEAMRTVPRHLFIPGGEADSYSDGPLPIGDGQTISQPYVVALMTELLGLKGDEKVLEIGTGSGYQAAVLSHLCKDVYTIEIVAPLYKRTTPLLKELGYKNIKTRLGDGYLGWEEEAPFDAIMITASADHIPKPLIDQLKEGGKIILPLKANWFYETLTVGTKRGKKLELKDHGSVRFVPMTGKALE
jgi:protein-L-isoaspartate(D-aspartate) O-methyltransferase